MDKYKVYIDGDEEAKQELKNDLENCSCIITFNGSLFDLPFIKMLIPGIEIPVCHIDLRFFCRRAGLQGGQKIIENLLGFERPKELKEVDGFEATILWHKYKEGDLESLKKLILYNAHDINGMKYIFEKITESILVKEKASIPISKIFHFTEYYSSVEFCLDRKYDSKVFVKPYTGKNGPVIFIDDLPDLSSHKVVGIDLTGSEKKPTGWAVLDNGIALTKTISTDEELIEETVRLNPSIISIDSPLSIPFGRTTVFDDDPYRKEFGITRECERIMAKRGVKSYPCLIQSMQKLTQRGMKLAAEFRSRGFKVIESYPGAAQDILGIPRKGKSLEYLIKGLYAFGIKGAFNDPKVTHDEIDAITSALVGYFFLANMYEALGNENEDYLIIPSLRNANQR